MSYLSAEASSHEKKNQYTCSYRCSSFFLLFFLIFWYNNIEQGIHPVYSQVRYYADKIFSRVRSSGNGRLFRRHNVP